MTVKYCAKCRNDDSGMCDQCADELLAELNAAPELPVKLSELELLKIEHQKLVAENAALKARTVTVPKKAYLRDMRCNVVRWSQVIDALSDAGIAFVRDDGELIAGTRETPDTDAAIAEIKAQGVDEFASSIGAEAAGLSMSSNTYKAIKSTVFRAVNFAANLRAGRKG